MNRRCSEVGFDVFLDQNTAADALGNGFAQGPALPEFAAGGRAEFDEVCYALRARPRSIDFDIHADLGTLHSSYCDPLVTVCFADADVAALTV